MCTTPCPNKVFITSNCLLCFCVGMKAIAHMWRSRTTFFYYLGPSTELRSSDVVVVSTLPAESACWPSIGHLLKESLIDCSIVCLPENLKGSKYSSNDVPNMRLKSRSSNRDLDSPSKAQYHIFYDGTVVISLRNTSKYISHHSSYKVPLHQLLRLTDSPPTDKWGNIT